MQAQLAVGEAQATASGGGGDALAELAAEFSLLDAKLKGTSGDGPGTLFLRLDKKQEKRLQQRKKEILTACGGDEAALTRRAVATQAMAALRRAIAENLSEMSGRWDSAVAWLSGKGFVVPDAAEPSGFKLLPRGQACAAFADGHPLVVGTVVADGLLEHLSFGEICAWLCLFLKEARAKDCTAAGLELPTPSQALNAACDRSDFLMDQVGRKKHAAGPASPRLIGFGRHSHCRLLLCSLF
jgi:hypothetical protein